MQLEFCILHAWDPSKKVVQFSELFWGKNAASIFFSAQTFYLSTCYLLTTLFIFEQIQLLKATQGRPSAAFLISEQLFLCSPKGVTLWEKKQADFCCLERYEGCQSPLDMPMEKFIFLVNPYNMTNLLLHSSISIFHGKDIKGIHKCLSNVDLENTLPKKCLFKKKSRRPIDRITFLNSPYPFPDTYSVFRTYGFMPFFTWKIKGQCFTLRFNFCRKETCISSLHHACVRRMRSA